MSRVNDPKIICKDVKENGMIDSVKTSTKIQFLTFDIFNFLFLLSTLTIT